MRSIYNTAVDFYNDRIWYFGENSIQSMIKDGCALRGHESLNHCIQKHHYQNICTHERSEEIADFMNSHLAYTGAVPFGDEEGSFDESDFDYEDYMHSYGYDSDEYGYYGGSDYFDPFEIGWLSLHGRPRTILDMLDMEAFAERRHGFHSPASSISLD